MSAIAHIARIPSAYQYGPPWMRNVNVTHGWTIRENVATWAAGAGDGGDVTQIGAIPLRPVTLVYNNAHCTYFRNFNSKGVAYLKHAVGGSADMFGDAVASSVSGTAVPLSIAIAGRLPQAPNNAGATNAQWCLWGFGRSTGVTPFIAMIGSRTFTACQFQRRNDAGTSDVGSSFDPGTSPFVIVNVYTGSTLTTIYNDTVIDNAIAATAGGACTLDQFTVGALRNNSAGLYSDLEWTDVIVGAGVAWTSAEYTPIKDYLKRKLGI